MCLCPSGWCPKSGPSVLISGTQCPNFTGRKSHRGATKIAVLTCCLWLVSGYFASWEGRFEQNSPRVELSFTPVESQMLRVNGDNSRRKSCETCKAEFVGVWDRVIGHNDDYRVSLTDPVLVRQDRVETIISTSYVERSNLSMRMACRRFTRLTNGFSKKLDNHAAAVSLYVAHYNLCRVHESLRSTPAVAQQITDHVWSIGAVRRGIGNTAD
jgi:hypothetical protein